MRSGRLLGRVAVTVTVATTLIVSVAPASASATQAHGGSDAARAAASYTSLQKWFASADGSGLYHEQYPVESSDNRYSYEWPFSQAHVASLDLTAMRRSGDRYLPALARHDSAQQHYWHADGTTRLPGFASGAEPPYGSGGDFFYDDNEWVGLQDVQHVALFHDRRSLVEAERIFRLVESGWDTDATHADAGGVFWTQATWSTDRNTVSNMPGAELGLRLYQLTGRHEYLVWAQRMYRWVNRYLQLDNGLYADHLSLAGVVDPTVWSYNQGVPIGVDVLFYEVTGQRRYLTAAVRTAQAAYRYFVPGQRLDGQPPYFNSIYFKNLLLLESVTGGHRYRSAMQRYADRMWRTHRDAQTGLFHFAAAGDEHVQMIEQAAMTQIYAVLAWRHRDYSLLY